MGNLAVYVLDTNVEVYLLEDGELKAETTCNRQLQVQNEGSRQIEMNAPLDKELLDVINKKK